MTPVLFCYSCNHRTRTVPVWTVAQTYFSGVTRDGCVVACRDFTCEHLFQSHDGQTKRHNHNIIHISTMRTKYGRWHRHKGSGGRSTNANGTGTQHEQAVTTAKSAQQNPFTFTFTHQGLPYQSYLNHNGFVPKLLRRLHSNFWWLFSPFPSLEV